VHRKGGDVDSVKMTLILLLYHGSEGRPPPPDQTGGTDD